MIRGSTPNFKVKIPCEESMVNKIRITFAQDRKTLFVKSKEDCVFNGKSFSVRLTQEESLQFKENRQGEIQAKILCANGSVLLHNIHRFNVEEALDNEVI